MSSPPCSALARRTWTRSGPRWAGTASTATSNGPVPSGSPPRNTRSTGSARPRTATAARSWTPVPCGPRSTRPPTWPACGTSRVRPWSGPPVRTRDGVVRAGQVALATSAFPALLRRLRPYVVPVYDYVLMTEPLSAAQRAGIGWHNRQGIGDSGNQFHYYRLTADDRILWGGYDAIYHF